MISVALQRSFPVPPNDRIREISAVEFETTEYGRKSKVLASEDVRATISNIGINKYARESGFDRKSFIRKLVGGFR
jgi:hypothetical protein